MPTLSASMKTPETWLRMPAVSEPTASLSR